MKKRLLCLLLCLTLSFTACANHAQAASDTAVAFSDDLGRSVTVDGPRRVAALLGSFAQVWTLAGGQICAAPDDAWTELSLSLPEDAVNLGSIHSLSLELLLAAQPDFILASTNTRQNVQWRDTLEQLGIPVAYFDVNDFSDYLRLLKIATEITGNPDAYETYGTAVARQIDSVVAQSKTRLEGQQAPTVLCLAASASGIHGKNSQGSVLSRILEHLGCRNIADSNTLLLENLSAEAILQEDPDYIFFIQRGDDPEGTRKLVEAKFLDEPAWSQLTAVAQGRVYFMEKELFNLKPNHRWGEAYEKAEEILSHGP